MTFDTLFQLYWTRHVLVRLRCPSNVKYFWRTHSPIIGQKEISTVSRSYIQDWFDDMAMRSKAAAVRDLSSLAAMVNWGIRRGYIDCANPCKGVETLKIKSRDRFLLPQELAKFKAALDLESGDYKDFFWLCLLTGARRGNVLSMRWAEIDTELAIWRIPAEKHKNDEPHLIPLIDATLAILQRRRNSSHSEYVFPGTGKTGHLVSPKRAWKRVLERANIDDLRIHDLRRTLASYLAIKGESQYVIGKALGHIDPRSTAIYARLNIAPVRDALNNIQSIFLQNTLR